MEEKIYYFFQEIFSIEKAAVNLPLFYNNNL